MGVWVIQWCGLYSGVGNLLTFVSFCDKNTEVWVICSAVIVRKIRYIS